MLDVGFNKLDIKIQTRFFNIKLLELDIWTKIIQEVVFIKH